MAAKSSNPTFGNIIDYVHWRGDLSFEASPWNDIDSLIGAELCYSNFGENERVFDNPQRLTIGDLATSDILTRYPQAGLAMTMKYREPLMESLPLAPRFRDIRILDQVNDVDVSRNIQFSATTLQVPGVGTVICYRGTDPNLVGWKEDFMMSYASPVPAQLSAISYLENAAARTEGDIYLTGHSKGGNLAVYSASHVSPEIQSRLRAVCTFDGPGLDDATMESEGYARIQPLIHSVIPTDSVIGLLMSYHQNYKVVESTASSLFQHEPGTWKLMGAEFLEREQVSLSSMVMDQTLHDWLNSCTTEQREIFTNAVFSLFEKKQKDKETEDSESASMDESSRQMVLFLLRRLMAIQAGNTFTARIKKPLEDAAEMLRIRLHGTPDPKFQSDLIQIDNQGNGFPDALKETMRTAAFVGLNQKNSLRLELFTEEMMSMMQTIAGDVNGTFHIEKEGPRFDLNLTVKTVLDRKQRDLLIASTSSRKNDITKSFLGRLRDAFEQAMASDKENVFLDLSQDSKDTSLKDWDRYEQSVLLRLADSVRIAIRGGLVSMTVTKVFSE
ncbi:MAG: DUF2974 domain-containing protein [Clostridiales bacterium]|nr:DUF2974 domain-containing protein [Clostridiales bacterium]